MAAKNFPGPNINRLIENDPQIVKIPMDNMGWGSRASTWGRMSSDPRSQNPSQPTAPEATIRHVKNEG